MASFMTSRISSHLPPVPDGFGPQAQKGAALQLPEFLREPFATAMSQSMLLPAFVALFGVGAALFMLGSDRPARGIAADDVSAGGAESGDTPTRRVRVRPSAAEGFDSGFDGFRDGFDDDDDYVEYTLTPAPSALPRRPGAAVRPARVREDRTEPLPKHIDHPRPAPTENWHGSPVESWHSLLEDEPDEAIGFAHNGFHVDDEQRFRPIEEFPPRGYRPADHDEPFFDDVDTYGGSTDRNGYHPPPRRADRRSDPNDWPGPGRHSPPDS
jgi:hypothetical protein